MTDRTDKAAKWAQYFRDHNRPICAHHEHFWAQVTDQGLLSLNCEGVHIQPDQALRLAHWIIEHFESTQRSGDIVVE